MSSLFSICARNKRLLLIAVKQALQVQLLMRVRLWLEARQETAGRCMGRAGLLGCAWRGCSSMARMWWFGGLA